MDYQKEFVIDFARRTRSNLEFIEAAEKRGEAVFEVTQLANSLLGLLVFPREHYMRSIPDTPLPNLVKMGWPDIRTTLGQLPQDTLRQLMRMLRNSIAHCNVEFVADQDSRITGIVVWNTNKDGHRTWQAELTIDDLRAIAFKFVELIENNGTPSGFVAGQASNL
jgi:hypothetical protein